MNETSRANIALEQAFLNAKHDFATSQELGIVTGEFHSGPWRYKSLKLLFSEIGSSRKKNIDSVPLSKTADKLARCYIMSVIATRASPQLTVARLNSFRSLAIIIGADDQLWFNVNRHLLNNVIADIKDSRSIATAYQRANNLQHFITYYNNVAFRIDGVEHRLCDRFVKWRHGVHNPTRMKLDPTTEAHRDRREVNYEENLHVAIATARSKICSAPSLEYVPGYYRIRLEALGFAMALGLRIGEVCSLSKNAVRRDHDTGRYYAMIATEKAALPAATAIPDIWVDPLTQAYAYLLEVCNDARSRAKDIERNGFSFVLDRLAHHRQSVPLNESQTAQLAVSELDPASHFFINEMVESLPISARELHSSGRFRNCMENLPKASTAKLVNWIDDRFERWDWADYSTYYGGYRITWENLATYSGAAASDLKKSTWFISNFRAMLKEMRNLGFFDPKAPITFNSKKYIKGTWLKIRTEALKNTGGGGCVAVRIGDFIENLKTIYSSYLSTHFQEEFDSDGNKSNGAWEGNDIRPGIQRKLSEHLIVIWENQFRGRGSLGILPRPVFRHDFYNLLNSKGGKITIFERLQIHDSNDQPFSISPHHIRRWVTTALLRSGPSETAIDLWMGRSPRQTRHYDYRTAKERAEYVRERYLRDENLPNDAIGRMVIQWNENELEKDQIEILVSEKLRALHYTPWGTCSRELYISPCDKGLMCLRNFGTDKGCASFQIDKSDVEAREQIVKLRDKYQETLAIFETHQSEVSAIIYSELNNTEPLDQHIQFALDMISGCDNALQDYKDNIK